jgi:histidyl-tRNA synthetase
MPRNGNKKSNSAFPLQSPKGMHDILPDASLLFERLRTIVKEIAEFYGFGQIETPIAEYAALFERGVGMGTDIIEKEMYVFRTKGGDRLALRPEGTAGVARAYLEHGMQTWPQPVKLWYWGPMFRHDAPQALRYREFHQAGFECFGEEHPAIDVELIQLTYRILEEFGIGRMRIEISSLGCRECRGLYKAALKAFYRPKLKRLCEDCKRRFAENPLRLLDCKEEGCVLLRRDAPEIVERLCGACRMHFKQVLGLLDDLGYPYLLNPHLVRGLDYYNRTVFEFFPEFRKEENLQSSSLAIASGGRFDYLTEMIGGPKIYAVGSAIGVERAIAAVKQAGGAIPSPKMPKVFLVQLGDLARLKVLQMIEEFRKADIWVATSLGRDSIKAQLKAADRIGATFALIIGHKEAVDGNVILRDMASGSQETIPAALIIQTLKERLKKMKR